MVVAGIAGICVQPRFGVLGLVDTACLPDGGKQLVHAGERLVVAFAQLLAVPTCEPQHGGAVAWL